MFRHRDLTAATLVLDGCDYTTRLTGRRFVSPFRAARDAAADVLKRCSTTRERAATR
ncbi:hypothetical protein HBNXHx_1703 [Haloferax volcanii]|uniref:Uncharacterized protein n=1 Tax=Haloferax lucentense (strain DSM 14919 / JCM 9276 / NCIMB 13854 / Aa 2.2) TaxID=1230452 RepID=M0GRX4_HALL2|nr:hypothetical protein D320_04725 [Haloferax sp. BAB-2207]ELZ74955.1 hypothetical protein C456_08363 [Haloferax lucentense DSM 14919]WEL27133.1 hypothetical protein SVXHx_2854 [Haloferax lucentense]WEL29809.1 hypothetical protein HBNXHx_1703 [Haloferax alexandrinus]